MKIDLTGYPKSIRPRLLSIYSKVIAVADGFDAATSRRVYQTVPIQPDQVLKEMWENPRRGYDPVVVKAFINLIGVYPVGTCVILDTYEVALVHTANPDVAHVHRPVVRIVTTPDGAPLKPGTVVDLSLKDANGNYPRTIVKVTDPVKYGINVGATLSDAPPLAERWRALGKTRALIPYVTAGFPTPAGSLDVLRRVAAAGADFLEVGVPFSDPLADGPTIQRTTQAALDQGMTLPRVLDLVRDAALDVPVIIMTYLNPVMAYGVERFIRDAQNAGAAGVLLTDLPAGADDAVEQAVTSSALSLIRLVAPTTDDERLGTALRNASGFVYLISRLGVTGARDNVPPISSTTAGIRAVTRLPIAVGFRIATPRRQRPPPLCRRRRRGQRADGRAGQRRRFPRAARAISPRCTREPRAFRRAPQPGAGVDGAAFWRLAHRGPALAPTS
jgi:tryptophan synthase alpha chain